MFVCVPYQNITAQKTPGRLTRNNRNTPFKPSTTQSVTSAVQNGSSVVGQAGSQQVGTRSGVSASPRGQIRSPKVLAGSPRVPPGKLQSPGRQKMTLEKSHSPAIDKSQHHAAESSFVREFGADVELARFNTTESDEDIAKVCGQMEDEVGKKP